MKRMEDSAGMSFKSAAENVDKRLRIDVLTIFPEFFNSPFQHGVVARALRTEVAGIYPSDLRTYTADRHRTVDDRPFGGGEGMVLKPEPIAAACTALGVSPKNQRDTTRESVVLLSAQGRRFTQALAHRMAGLKRLVLICGRYEGVDERIAHLVCDEELSIGDYVLSGGELGAAVIIDAVVRLLPGVLGNADSSHNESFGSTEDVPRVDSQPSATSAAGGILDYPHYTRPAMFDGAPVPDVLLAGDHLAIKRWRRQQALQKTLKNRPDLLAGVPLSRSDQEFLRSLKLPPENL